MRMLFTYALNKELRREFMTYSNSFTGQHYVVELVYLEAVVQHFYHGGSPALGNFMKPSELCVK